MWGGPGRPSSYSLEYWFKLDISERSFLLSFVQHFQFVDLIYRCVVEGGRERTPSRHFCSQYEYGEYEFPVNTNKYLGYSGPYTRFSCETWHKL